MGSIDLTSKDGQQISAYEARPDGECRGAVVVVQEVFGVNSHIRSVADGYAQSGYYAIAPSLYARYGNKGQTQTVDPTINGEHFPEMKGERGHPIRHVFTSQIPSSQCMVCHMHQPNMFMNSFLGYTMWDYESDAPAMWPDSRTSPSPIPRCWRTRASSARRT